MKFLLLFSGLLPRYLHNVDQLRGVFAGEHPIAGLLSGPTGDIAEGERRFTELNETLQSELEDKGYNRTFFTQEELPILERFGL